MDQKCLTVKSWLKLLEFRTNFIKCKFKVRIKNFKIKDFKYLVKIKKINTEAIVAFHEKIDVGGYFFGFFRIIYVLA